jgi:hypothetical protein
VTAAPRTTAVGGWFRCAGTAVTADEPFEVEHPDRPVPAIAAANTKIMANPAGPAIPSARDRMVPVSRHLMCSTRGVVAPHRFAGGPNYFPTEKDVPVGWVAELSPTVIR